MKQRIAILCIFIIMLFSGCAVYDDSSAEDIKSETTQQQENSTPASVTENLENISVPEGDTKESDLALSGYKERIPCEYQYKESDQRNNLSNSIYDKNYNDNMGNAMSIMEIQ